jgi:hypothetical protein
VPEPSPDADELADQVADRVLARLAGLFRRGQDAEADDEPEAMSGAPDSARTTTAGCQKDMIMNDINVDQPVRMTAELAKAIARMLSAPGAYPGTTAEDVTRELAKPHGGRRGITGLFAADALRDAIDQDAVGPDAAGVLEVRV